MWVLNMIFFEPTVLKLVDEKSLRKRYENIPNGAFIERTFGNLKKTANKRNGFEKGEFQPFDNIRCSRGQKYTSSIIALYLCVSRAYISHSKIKIHIES